MAVRHRGERGAHSFAQATAPPTLRIGELPELPNMQGIVCSSGVAGVRP